MHLHDSFSSRPRQRRWRYKALTALCALLSFIVGSNVAHSQFPLELGFGAATCFSGYVSNNPSMGIADDFVVGTMDLHNPVGPAANWMPPMYHGPSNSWKSSRLGQIFGLAIDSRRHIYVSASTVFGQYTGANAWGPGGPGAIYRLNGVTGAVTNFITSVPFNAFGTPTMAIGTSTLPNGNGSNNGPGLGNICYDRTHDRLFVSNFENGMIYRINPLSGVIDGVYDPVVPANPPGTTNPAMVADGGTSGFAPRGDRVWGLGYNHLDNRLYYGVWVEDEGAGNYTATTYNVVRSVALDGFGNIMPATDRLEIVVPNFVRFTNGQAYTWSMPISDIAFPTNGDKILIAERCMRADVGGYTNYSAHTARVIEYTRTSTSSPWGSMKFIYIGDGTGGSNTLRGANSAGGIDYGYRAYDARTKQNIDCDSVVWASGDYLFNAPGFGMIYGLQRSPAAGNTLATITSTGYFIDLNGVGGTQDKTYVGDVEIYRDYCKQAPPQGPCDQTDVSMTYFPTVDSCCWKLRITNGVPNFFTSLSIRPLAPAQVSVTGIIGPSGWSVANTGALGTWTPPAGTFVPTGITDSLIFCLRAQIVPQVMILTWHGANGVNCYDTLTADCQVTPPPSQGCIRINTTKIECKQANANGTVYNYSISFTNLSPFSAPPFNYPAQNLLASSATPGVSIAPSSHTFPPIPYGGSSSMLPFTISGPGAVPGAQVCIVLQLHGARLNNDYVWCCPPDTFCFILPPCKDCCKGFTKGVGLTSIKHNGAGITTLNLNMNAGPAPIIKVQATVVAAFLKRNGSSRCNPSNWTPISGEIASPAASLAGLPLVIQGPPFGTPPPPNFRDVAWGTLPSGVNLSSAPLALNIAFPAPPLPLWGCSDSLRFCVRYTFTDTNCVTCDTVICYQQRRTGKFIINPGGDVPHVTKGTIGILTPKVRFGTILMSDGNLGRLVVTVPRADEGSDPVSDIRIVGLSLRPQLGVQLNRVDETGSVDGVVDIKAQIGSGEERSFALNYNNYAGLRVFSNTLTIQYMTGDNPDEVLETTEILEARTPEGFAQGTLAADGGPRVENVRTYALIFSNTSANGDNIGTIVLKPQGQAAIIAVGPTSDSSNVRLQTYREELSNGETSMLKITPMLPSSAVESPVEPEQTLRPIYVTVCNANNNTAVFNYEALDDNGNPISTGQLLLNEPLSIVTSTDEENEAVTGDSPLALRPIYPNPTSNAVTVQFRLSLPLNNVSLTVTDIQGNKVVHLLNNQTMSNGAYAYVLDTGNLPAGTYYVTLQAGSTQQTQKLVIVR